jgi:hypothetical protein
MPVLLQLVGSRQQGCLPLLLLLLLMRHHLLLLLRHLRCCCLWVALGCQFCCQG